MSRVIDPARFLWSAALLVSVTASGLQAQGQPAPAPPRDTTPPGAYFGVTEYQLARQKLEQDMQKGGFSVYIIGDMEGLAAAAYETDIVAATGAARRSMSASARSSPTR